MHLGSQIPGAPVLEKSPSVIRASHGSEGIRG
jgi:hypothetical protein